MSAPAIVMDLEGLWRALNAVGTGEKVMGDRFEIEYEEVVAADRLKAVRRKLVPTDNLKRSVAKALLLKSKSVSSEKKSAADYNLLLRTKT
ncbi:hypothetical protein L1987_02233 [Smallanthus sonchifolius]|uniref:Uncharacterized protein n=1 Tax=Smallanthus sonchifolius TaxID=185202 RepID=A0ACB9K754_9ASTR|nr:hypothetical protein L1987_02233 [Smallanthus sonchifolius]